MAFVKMNGVEVRGTGASYTSAEETTTSISSFRAKREESERRDHERLVEKARQEQLAVEAVTPVKFPVHKAENVRATVVSAADPAPTMREALGLDATD